MLFATGQYQQAAAAIYAVLSAGPGWNWTTLASLYSNTDVYTEQLRALETYCNEHPNQADVRFLLAYHYLTDGSADAAAAQFKEVVKLKPSDQLSAQLLAGLTQDQSATAAAPTPEQPAAKPAPAQNVTTANLIGNWKSDRPDGSSICTRAEARIPNTPGSTLPRVERRRNSAAPTKWPTTC